MQFIQMPTAWYYSKLYMISANIISVHTCKRKYHLNNLCKRMYIFHIVSFTFYHHITLTCFTFEVTLHLMENGSSSDISVYDININIIVWHHEERTYFGRDSFTSYPRRESRFEPRLRCFNLGFHDVTNEPWWLRILSE